MHRNLALTAGTSLDGALRRRWQQAPRQVAVAAALVGAAALAVLVVMGGAELQVWLASGQNGVLSAVIGFLPEDATGRSA